MGWTRRTVLVVAAGAAWSRAAAAGGPPVVAAAADLKFALTEVAQGFESETGQVLRLTFGSSGNFATQIQQGAPFELFLSADEELARRLAALGLTEGDGALYGIGRVVLLVPAGSPLLPDGTLADLARAVDDGRLRKLAMANPLHAPYGRRAEEALRHVGLWDRVAPRLVLGENVAQAAQFALSGSAEGGLVAYALALAPEMAERARFALVPDAWHRPLRQRMVLLKGAGPVARAFYAYLQEDTARRVLRRWGFALPVEAG